MNRRSITLAAALAAPLVVALALGLALGLALSGAVSAQGAPRSAEELAAIAEATGQLPLTEATSEACVYDAGYRLYLCPPAEPAAVPQRDPASAARAAAILAGGGGLLLIPDSTNDRVMAFDPATGDLVDADFIPPDATNLTTPKDAILSAGGNTILVSDQIDDVVQEYDLDGNYIGVFAPAGGPNPAIMENILGIALRPNGNLLVTVSGGANEDSVAEFDTAGNYLGNFVAIGSGGLDGPFDVYLRLEWSDWLVPSINSNQILRYDQDTGAPNGIFAGINDFPEQVDQAANLNVLVANFSGSQEGIVEFDPEGVVIDIYNPAVLGGYRGVYELPNGNILTTNAGGVHEIDRLGNLVETKIADVSAQYIELISQEPAISLNKTVGLDADICASEDEVSVPAGTEVTYCYEVTNTGAVTLTLHDLDDSELGAILDALPYSLVPGASAFLTQSAVIDADTVNTATWTAYNPGPIDVVTATDTATVDVTGEPDVEVSPAALSSIQPPDVQLTQTLAIANLGTAGLIWDLEESGPPPATGGCQVGEIPWLSAAPISGTVPPAGSTDVAVTFDSAGLALGVYTGALCVNSNDPDEPLVTVPVSLTVSEEPAGVKLYLPAILNQPAGAEPAPAERPADALPLA
ncbi:MAG: DUF7507 domain-containing protein, partial [Candidatus Promineifilaceae bacterium]